MAKIIVFMLSIGTDLMTMAFVPMRQLASTCASLSLPEGFIYARWEYCAARHTRGYEGKYLRVNNLAIGTSLAKTLPYRLNGGRLGGNRELA